MAIDNRFYQIANELPSTEVSRLADVSQFTDHKTVITHACQPSEVTSGSVCYIAGASFIEELGNCDGAVILTTKELAPLLPATATIFTTQTPRIAFAHIISYLYQKPVETGISPNAVINRTASIGQDVLIADYAVIEEGAVIGDGAVIGAHSVIGANCVIGPHSRIGAHVTIEFARLGAHVKVGPQTVIGSEGFGFDMTKTGAVRLPHLGLVVIGDHADIGAHCAIDKGVLGDTHIAPHVMIDNLVHIAHNVQIGEKSILLGQVGIAGSTHIGKGCILAGQVGVKDHVTIADGCVVLSAAKVITDLPEKGHYGGDPAVPARQHWREVAALRKLAKTKRGA